MGLITWVAIIAIVLVAIGLGVGVFFSGLFRGAEIVGEKLQDNEAVQKAEEEVKEFVTDTSSEELVMTTNEAAYDVGEPVTITVKNIGDRTLEFPDSSLGMEIENTGTGEKYSVIAAQVITELGPGESKDITWDEDAPEGDYIATVETTDKETSAQVEFKITG
jgi:uncharacterized membrane protein